MLWYHRREIRQTPAAILDYPHVMGLSFSYSRLCRLLCHIGPLVASVRRYVYSAAKSIAMHSALSSVTHSHLRPSLRSHSPVLTARATLCGFPQ